MIWEYVDCCIDFFCQVFMCYVDIGFIFYIDYGDVQFEVCVFIVYMCCNFFCIVNWVNEYDFLFEIFVEIF